MKGISSVSIDKTMCCFHGACQADPLSVEKVAHYFSPIIIAWSPMQQLGVAPTIDRKINSLLILLKSTIEKNGTKVQMYGDSTSLQGT